MSRSYAPTELKRRLRPALEELEGLGFLEPLDAEERYSWVSRGSWRIILIRGQAAQGEPMPPTEASDLVDALKARGVTPKTRGRAGRVASAWRESGPSSRSSTGW